MLSQKKSPEDSAAPTAGKGRPTPSRREAEARRQRPLVPADRKEAKRQARAKRDEAYRLEQEAMMTGDERHMPYNHRGRVRRFTRDWVDARWSLSEFVFPAMLLFLVGMLALSLLPNKEIAQWVILGITVFFYVLLALSILEGFLVWARLKKRIAEALPRETVPRGTWFYCYSRMVMARRWRTPRPQVARGEFPEAPRKAR